MTGSGDSTPARTFIMPSEHLANALVPRPEEEKEKEKMEETKKPVRAER